MYLFSVAYWGPDTRVSHAQKHISEGNSEGKPLEARRNGRISSITRGAIHPYANIGTGHHRAESRTHARGNRLGAVWGRAARLA